MSAMFAKHYRDAYLPLLITVLLRTRHLPETGHGVTDRYT